MSSRTKHSSSSRIEGAIPHLLYELHQLETTEVTMQNRRLGPSDPAENGGDVVGARALWMKSKPVKAAVMCVTLSGSETKLLR